jgi:surface antigen
MNVAACAILGCAALTVAACTTGSGSGPPSEPLAGASGTGLSRLAGADGAIAAAAEQQVLASEESGKPVEWRSTTNADRHGSVVAGPLATRNGLACRPFTHTIYIGGVPQTARRAACRQPDGRWRVAA